MRGRFLCEYVCVCLHARVPILSQLVALSITFSAMACKPDVQCPTQERAEGREQQSGLGWV